MWCLLGTSVEKLKLLETLKINFVMPEDKAIMSSKSDLHGQYTDHQKVQTDGFSALYSRSCISSYIVTCMLNIPNIHNNIYVHIYTTTNI